MEQRCAVGQLISIEGVPQCDYHHDFDDRQCPVQGNDLLDTFIDARETLKACINRPGAAHAE